MTRARFPLLPLFLLALLVAGGGAHAWHHLLDPHCESAAPRESHPCLSCSALHAATTADAAIGVWVPAESGHDVSPRGGRSVARALALGVATPRAPPTV